MGDSTREVKKEGGKTVQSVQNTIPDIIRDAIARFRESGLSYEKIAQKLEISKSEVYYLEKKLWYPKKREIENKIYLAVQGLRDLPISVKNKENPYE